MNMLRTITLIVIFCTSSYICCVKPKVSAQDLESASKRQERFKLIHTAAAESKNKTCMWCTDLLERVKSFKECASEPENINRIKYHTACTLGYVSNILLMYLAFDQGKSSIVSGGPPNEVIHLPIINYHNGTVTHLGQSYYFHRANDSDVTNEAVWYTANSSLLPVFNEPQFICGMLGFSVTFFTHAHAKIISAIKELYNNLHS